MADEIIVTYKAVPEGFDKVGAAVENVTQQTAELKNQIKSTYAGKELDQAVKKLYEQGDVMGALIEKYGTATGALKAMEKELSTMAALGQRNTKEFKDLAEATAELKDELETFTIKPPVAEKRVAVEEDDDEPVVTPSKTKAKKPVVLEEDSESDDEELDNSWM